MAEQDWGSEGYIADNFRAYYASGASRVEPPTEMRQREFGFLSFGGRSMFRHIGFEDTLQLRGYMREYAPAHTYFSAAYYEDPRANMEYKGWLGADLVFDIDADHFDLPCQKAHDRWTCSNCGEEGMGHAPDLCPSCQKAKFVEESWLCNECLTAAKYEAQKLLDILIQDFGYEGTGDLSVNFSGNRGYHVHVRNPTVKGLDQLSRREIVDYILAIGIEAEYHGFVSRAVGGGSSMSSDGWRMRTARALYDFIGELTPEGMRELKLAKAARERLEENKDAILETLVERHPSGIFRYMTKNTLERLMAAAVKGQASSIDTVVTTDLRRLIRLPNTLHGKTGWLTQNVPIIELPDYDPLIESIAFVEGTESIHIRRTPIIELGGEVYGPFEDETVELPLAVAMFILGRKAGRVVS